MNRELYQRQSVAIVSLKTVSSGCPHILHTQSLCQCTFVCLICRYRRTIRYAGMLCTGIHAVAMTLSMTSSHYIHAHREQSDHFSDDEIHNMQLHEVTISNG